jgi:hypothetical protein
VLFPAAFGLEGVAAEKAEDLFFLYFPMVFFVVQILFCFVS